MKEDRKLLKWALVIVPVVVAILAIYPPHRKLKAGIDLAGGSSLLFEIDTSGLDARDKTGLAERVMQVLKRRVDPTGQAGTIWRAIGNNRLEIQMPRPSKEALERRKKYEEARDKLAALNIRRNEVMVMLHASVDKRSAARAKLIRGVSAREALLDEAVAAYDAYVELSAGDDVSAELDARSAFEDAVSRVLETCIPPGRLSDILAVEDKETERAAELKKLRDLHPAEGYQSALDEVVIAYDAWEKDKGVLEDPSDLKRRIRGAGVLEFRILAERNAGSPTMTSHSQVYLQQPIAQYTDQLQKRGPRPRPGDLYRWIKIVDPVAFLDPAVESMEELERKQGILTPIVEKYAGKWYVLSHAEQKFGLLKGGKQKWKLVGAFAGVNSRTGGPAVNFQLDPRGGSLFEKMTAANTERPLAIILDNVAQSWAGIREAIRENGQISGTTYTQDDVSDLVTTLNAGSLPARLIETPLMERTIGPNLGEHNRTVGMRAAVIGGIAVALFILLYYRFAGMVANLALAMNLLFVLAIMAVIEATFTLPGIAGLILTVGMAVDANVLIFERIREERDRGVGLRKALRTGYERAFSTIVDANVTTLIICVILGYLGTEEVKGFAMVLGFGIVTSMFTSLFVTRHIFTTLIDIGWVKSLSMARFFHRPSFDWLAMRRMFWPVSTVIVILAGGLTFFVSAYDRESLYDIEFLGGTSVQIDLKPDQELNDEDVRRLITGTEPGSAASWLSSAADRIGSATVSAGSTPTSFTIRSDSLTAEQIEALTKEILERRVERGGFERSGPHVLTIDVKDAAENEAPFDKAALTAALAQAALEAHDAAANLAAARVQSVRGIDEESELPTAFEVTSVEANKELVKAAILAAMGDRLAVERSVSFVPITDPRLAPHGYFPIDEDADYLSDVIADVGVGYDIRPFKGGAVMVFDQLNPPISKEAFDKRVREIRLLPQFSQYEARPFSTIGLNAVGTDDGVETYSRIAYISVDENIPYYDDPDLWESHFASVEMEQVREALSTEKSLRKVTQFAPQIAAQTQQQALVAIVMALAAIVAYIWIRFGQAQFGLAAIVALVHDVTITIGLVAVSHYVYGTFFGRALGLADFKIDLPLIAALLTIIGYSLNDTIVVFDRIRENRGKLKSLTPGIINNSINQCLSRTVLTSVTTFLAVAIMYAIGGAGIHGFCFALLAGIIVGTYSSVGVAAPLLFRPKVLNVVVYVLGALATFGAFALVIGDVSSRRTFLAVAGVLIAAALLWAIMLEVRTTRPLVRLAGRPA